MTPTEFKEIFHGSDIAHGHSTLTGAVGRGGKAETKNITHREQATDRDWAEHLEGTQSLGMPPINSQSQVRWGAIDVDEYGVSHEEVLRDIYTKNLPFVPFKTKSGGLHIYLFLTSWVPAKWMIDTLQAAAAGFGLGRVEIFPKQAALNREEGSTDVGNWINLPYFGNTRGCLKMDGTEMTHEEFLSFYRTKVHVPAQIERSPLRPEDTEFPDGPPCLNAIFGRKVTTQNRNISLFNLATYYKRADPVTWRENTILANTKYWGAEALPREEVMRTVIAAQEKKEYKFQCGTEPMCKYCDSSACASRKFGIPPSEGSIESLATNRSLTKVETDPVTWYLDLSDPDGTIRRIRLTTDELQNPAMFQRRAMEVLHTMVVPPKREEWTQMVNALMKHLNVVTIPASASPEGIFNAMLDDWLLNHAVESEEGKQRVLKAMPCREGDKVHFRPPDITAKAIENRALPRVSGSNVAEWLRKRGATYKPHTIKGKTYDLWTLEFSEPNREPLVVPPEHHPVF